MEIYPALFRKLDRFCETCGMPMKNKVCQDCGNKTRKREVKN